MDLMSRIAALPGALVAWFGHDPVSGRSSGESDSAVPASTERNCQPLTVLQSRVTAGKEQIQSFHGVDKKGLFTGCEPGQDAPHASAGPVLASGTDNARYCATQLTSN